MRSFKDSADRSWNIKVDISCLKRIKSLVGVDLLDVDSGILSSTISNPLTLCDVLFAAIKPQADAQKVSDIEFGESLNGTILEAAQELLYLEVADFFPVARKELLLKILAKSKENMDKVLEEAKQHLEK
jgi:hypothetical protein